MINNNRIKVLSIILITISLFAQEKTIRVYTLEECLKSAIENNISLKISAKDMVISQAQLRQAQSANYPSVELNSVLSTQDEYLNFVQPAMKFQVPEINLGMLNFNMPPIDVPAQEIKLADKTNLMTSIDILYPLFTGGKISSVIEQAENNVMVAKYSARNSENELIYNTKKVFYACLLTKELGNIASQTIERMRATLRITENLYLSGSESVNKIDYLKNKMFLETLQAMVSEIRANKEIAFNGLKFLTGVDLSDEIDVAPTQREDSLSATFHELVNEAFRSNPLINKLHHARLIYGSRADEARSEYYPSIGLFAKYQRMDNSYQYGLATKENNNLWIAGIGLRMPIFNGFLTSNRIQEAEFEIQKIELQEKYYRDALMLQVKEIHDKMDIAMQKILHSRKARDIAIENRELSERAYQNDLAPIEEFIQSQFIESFARASYEYSLYERNELMARLEKTLGTSYAGIEE